MNRPIRLSLAAVLLSTLMVAGCDREPDTAQTPATEPVPAQAAPLTPEPAPAPAPAKPKPKPSPRPTPTPAQPQPMPAPQVCYDCGTVSSITPVTKKGEAGAMGTLGGAVIGGIIGHQFGGGRGKDVATVAGAAGGAMAGREIEKRARSSTVYDIGVRMEDGSQRTVTVADPAGVTVGSRVRVDGNNLIPR
jgi:outer membrane lipoprotein SlyB